MALNPRLIYCAVSGFGQNGPERGTAAFDGKLQAMSGIMSITGHEDKGPTRAGFALCDTIGGMTAAFAVASALFQRSHTGEGQFVDVAMLDAALAFIAPQIAEYTVTGHKHRQFGNLSSTGKVTGNRFKAGEGDLMLAVMTEKQFSSLMTALGRPDTLSDPRFADWPSRSRERAGPARDHRGGAGRRQRAQLGKAADRSRRALRRDLADFRDRASPAARTPRGHAGDRSALRRRCASPAPASASNTTAAASTARRPCSANTPTRSSPKPGTRRAISRRFTQRESFKRVGFKSQRLRRGFLGNCS